MKKADSSVVLIIFNGVLYHVRVYTLVVSSMWICTRESMSWYITNRYPVNAYLTTQIEPVQNKVIYQPLFEFEVKQILLFTVHSFLVQRGDVHKNKGQYTFR